MNNSAQIRKENKKAIYRFMLDGEKYTKQQVANGTGLSVATCNTLLNDMQSQGIVSGGNKLPGEVGRSSVLYQIREEHESYLAVHFYIDGEKRVVETIMFSAIGRICSREKQIFEYADYDRLEQTIARVVERTPKIVRIIIGTPSIAENGLIKYCDIPELEKVPLGENLESRFGVPVSMENDMHHKAYGYYKKERNPEEVITLGNFPRHVLPGTATIYKGKIIRGANGFAGMTGFLPYDISREEQLTMLEPLTCVPFIARSVCAIIVLLNPDTIVLTGELINEEVMKSVQDKCMADIPQEYMPAFRIVDNFDEYYLVGMYQLAVDRKEL